MRRWPPKPARSAICGITAGSSFIAAIAPSPHRRASATSRRSFGIANVPLDREAALCARAVARAGLPSRRALDRRDERDQSAGADPRLRGALCRAWRDRVDTATRARCIAPSRIGASIPRPARSMPATSSSRSGPGRRICSSRSASAAACGQARLSPAFPGARQCRAQPAGARCRERLLPRADGAGHPADHRRRICRRATRRRRRCNSIGCCRRRASCFRSARRSSRSRGSARGRALPIRGR